eukprot:4808079-Heterocapsa_arctica.AAC.1
MGLKTGGPSMRPTIGKPRTLRAESVMSGHADMICRKRSAATLTWAQTLRTRGLMASLHACASGCRRSTRERRRVMFFCRQAL